jgi:hypothetical protein
MNNYLKMGTEPFGGCNLLHPGLCSGITVAAHPEAKNDHLSSASTGELLTMHRVCDSFHKNCGCLCNNQGLKSAW